MNKNNLMPVRECVNYLEIKQDPYCYDMMDELPKKFTPCLGYMRVLKLGDKLWAPIRNHMKEHYEYEHRDGLLSLFAYDNKYRVLSDKPCSLIINSAPALGDELEWNDKGKLENIIIGMDDGFHFSSKFDSLFTERQINIGKELLPSFNKTVILKCQLLKYILRNSYSDVLISFGFKILEEYDDNKKIKLLNKISDIFTPEERCNEYINEHISFNMAEVYANNK